jgi:uncharacterized protein (DUF488 family)
MPATSPDDRPPIYTLGYFGQEWVTFLSLLTRYGIEEILDVRASPSSPFLPCFSRTGLERDLPLWGRRYRPMGLELGGRRSATGIEEAVSLARGVDQVLGLWRQGRNLALFCIEENPWRCHRGTRIAPALLAQGARVVHIRGDGSLEEHPQAAPEIALASPSREEPR